MSHTSLLQLRNGKFDNSSNGPGFFNMLRLARALRCSVADLGAEEPERRHSIPSAPAYTPNVSSFLAAYSNSAATLAGFRNLINFCQIYLKPVDGKIRLHWSGTLSLAHRILNTKEVLELQEAFNLCSEETKSKIREGHLAAWEKGYSITVVEVDQRIPKRAVHARIKYIQAAFRVSDSSDSDKIVIYCELI